MRLAPVVLVLLLAASGVSAKRLPRPVDRKRLVRRTGSEGASWEAQGVYRAPGRRLP
jgi:hypothetical protein